MGYHSKCSKKNKHRHSRCHKHKKCVDRSLITQLPNALSNQINEKLVGGRITPPDPIIATGPKSVIIMVNTLISIHRKDTMEEIFIDSTSNFWSEIESDQFNPGDVYPVYDEFSKKFFLLAIDFVNITGQGFITLLWVAVSKNSDPQNGDDFFKYLYVSPGFIDFPKMAVDKEAVYITSADFDGITFEFLGHNVRVFDKEPLVDGSSSPSEIVPVFQEIFVQPRASEFIFPLQPRPSQKSCSDEKNVEKVLLIQALISEPGVVSSGNKLRVLQVKNVLTNPEVVFADVEVPEFSTEPDQGHVPQPPPVIVATDQPIVELDAGRGRIISGVTSYNSVWATHCVLSDDGLGRWVSRWYEIDVSEFLTENILELVQAGNADPGGTTNQTYPSINVNKCGDMAIQFTLVGEDQYPAIAYTGRLKNDPKGTIRLPLEVPIGGNLYYQHERTVLSGRNRWGDYSGLAIDPCDHKTFWLFNMYPIAVNPGVVFSNPVVLTDAGGVGPFEALAVINSPPFTEISGPGRLTEPLSACSSLTNNPDLTGQIGITQFTNACGSATIVLNVEAANAEATLILDDLQPTVQFGGSPDQTKPAVSIGADDAAILLAAIEASEEPINITITKEPLGPATFGSDWTTFIGTFKMNKGCKELNAPQTRNLISVGSNSAEIKRTVSKEREKQYVKIPPQTIKIVSMVVTIDEDGKKKRTFTVKGETTCNVPGR